jgi:hypothetical protein
VDPCGRGGNTALQDARLLADVLAEAHHDDLDLRVAIGCYERLMRANGDAAVRAASPAGTAWSPPGQWPSSPAGPGSGSAAPSPHCAAARSPTGPTAWGRNRGNATEEPSTIVHHTVPDPLTDFATGVLRQPAPGRDDHLILGPRPSKR